MIILGSSTEVLRAKLSGAPATSNPTFLFSFGDDGDPRTLGNSPGVLNGTTHVDLVGSPDEGFVRVIKAGHIYNADTATVTVTIEHYDGTTTTTLLKTALLSGATLTFGDNGFAVGGGSVGDMTTAVYDPASVAEQLVGLTATQVLTNKDLTGSSNTFPVSLQSQLVGINDQTGTTYTLVIGDAGKDVRCNNASAITLTIPPNSSVAFPTGTLIAFSQKGAGAVTATAGTGVTLNHANGVATTAQYDCRVLEKTDSDTWRVW